VIGREQADVIDFPNSSLRPNGASDAVGARDSLIRDAKQQQQQQQRALGFSHR